MPYTLLTPKRTVVGEGALEAAEKDFAALGKKALIVTGNIVRKGEAYRRLTVLLEKIGVGQVSHVASLTHTDSYFPQLIEALRPQGQLALIDDPKTLDVVPMKRKALSLHWELMFTRSLYETPDMIAQHELLNRVSALIDQGVLKTTLGEHFGVINAENLRRAHAVIESGKARGKIVLEGF